ncbi:MAG: GGDEF domain-containing protein [Xanthobacteraceae bacterium]
MIELASVVRDCEIYTPVISVGAQTLPPENVLVCDVTDDTEFNRLAARLTAALRVRTLHETVQRRQSETTLPSRPEGDPLQDATALLVGRSATYPALSVATGQRVGVVGALSIEAAARHLNVRDIDGIILGEGFSARMTDAFLTVLTEDARFRTLPVVIASSAGNAKFTHDLANLEIAQGSADEIVAIALPLIRQHALEARLGRRLKSLDAGGLLDPRTGLLTNDAFDRTFAKTVSQSLETGSGFSAARFVFDGVEPRALFDAARILSRLMRKMDFASLREDGSIVAAFAETELRKAHVIARRLASVLKHTMLSDGDRSAIDPQVTLATLRHIDSVESFLGRLRYTEQRQAS